MSSTGIFKREMATSFSRAMLILRLLSGAKRRRSDRPAAGTVCPAGEKVPDPFSLTPFPLQFRVRAA